MPVVPVTRKVAASGERSVSRNTWYSSGVGKKPSCGSGGWRLAVAFGGGIGGAVDDGVVVRQENWKVGGHERRVKAEEDSVHMYPTVREGNGYVIE
jgi:hypothetical protein